MHNRAYGGWYQAGFDAWALGAEAMLVAGLRLGRIAAGGAGAAQEAQLMVVEKIQAAAELQGDLILHAWHSTPLATTRRSLRHYRRKVAANRRRLQR